MSFRLPLAAVAAIATVTVLAGCPTGNVGPITGPSGQPTTQPSGTPSGTPQSPAPSPGVTAKAGAASDAYVKAVAELRAKGVTGFSLYRIKGDPVSAKGLASES